MEAFLTSLLNLAKARQWSAVPLRLIVGYGFVAHGYAKVMNGPDHFAASLQALGVPAPHVMAWATIGFELVGGLAVLAGACIPLISVPLAAILLVAAITVHLPYGFSSIKLRAVTEAGPQFGPPGVRDGPAVPGGSGGAGARRIGSGDSRSIVGVSAPELSAAGFAGGSRC